MEKNQWLFRKIEGNILLFVIVSCLLFISCNSNKTGPGSKGLAASKCFTLSRAEMKTWLQTGWQNPNDRNYIPRIYLTTDSGSTTSPGIQSYPVHIDVKGNDSISKADEIVLRNQPGTTKCGINSSLYRAPQFYFLPTEGFYDPLTKDLIQFDYLQFVQTSKIVNGKDYISFDLYTVNGNVTIARGESWPCPDYCCPGPKCPAGQLMSGQ